MNRSLMALAALAWFGLTSAASGVGLEDKPLPPSRAAAELERAIEAVDGERYSQAIALLRRVIERDPSSADAYNYLGFSYRKLGNYELAFRYYRRALELDPDHIGAHEYMGEAYAETGDIAKAEEHLEHLRRICGTGADCEPYEELKEAIDKAARGS